MKVKCVTTHDQWSIVCPQITFSASKGTNLFGTDLGKKNTIISFISAICVKIISIGFVCFFANCLALTKCDLPHDYVNKERSPLTYKCGKTITGKSIYSRITLRPGSIFCYSGVNGRCHWKELVSEEVTKPIRNTEMANINANDLYRFNSICSIN